MNETFENTTHTEETREQTSFEYQPLKRHAYPGIIKFFFCFAIVYGAFVIYMFMRNDLYSDHKIAIRMKEADNAFYNKEYRRAIRMYGEIVEKHPKCSYGKKQAAKACFALVSEDKDFFECGAYFLVEESLTFSERIELESYLPELYKRRFKWLFKKEDDTCSFTSRAN